MSERKAERNAILKCMNTYAPFQSVSTRVKTGIATEIEIGIYKHATAKARERHLQIDWSDTSFTHIYFNIAYGVKINLDVDSSVNASYDEQTRTYLVSRIYNFAIVEALYNVYEEALEGTEPIARMHAGLAGLSEDSIAAITSHYPIIEPEALGAASSVVLNPKINHVYIELIRDREKQGIVMKYSKMYKCGNCKKSKTRFREIQSASADEGGTLFISCIACGHRWRQYS